MMCKALQRETYMIMMEYWVMHGLFNYSA